MARIDTRQSRDFLGPWFWQLLWAIVIGLELFLLLDDITLFRAPKSELPGITGERIAELRESVGGVRWQNPKDVLWNESRAGQPLYEGQSVMTLSESSARLVFDARENRSTEIEIGPKTLLQLQTKKTGPDRPLLLSLARGTLRAETARDLELTAGELTVSVGAGSRFSAANVDATKSRSGKPSLRVTIEEGEARSGGRIVARDQTIEIPILAPGETTADATPIVIEGTGAGVASPTPSPAPSATPSGAPTASAPAATKPARAKARALPPPTLRAPVFRKHSVPTATPAGESPGASFFDLLVRPARADEAPPSPRAEEWEIELRWNPVPGARAYRVEISRTRNFTKKIAEDSAADAHFTWLYRRGMENSKGRIFYRIATVNEQGEPGGFSAPVPFAIPREIRSPPAVAKRESKPKGEPMPSATTAAEAAATPIPFTDSAWTIRAAAELTSRTETSDFSQLRRVDAGGAFIHEAFSAARLSRKNRIEAEFRANHYESEGSALAKTRSYHAALIGEKTTSVFSGRLSFGAAVALEDHFEKADANTLSLARGISLGPSATLAGRGWALALRVPLTGAVLNGFLGGPYGPSLRFERDWEIATLGRGSDRTSICASISGEGVYHLWGDPSGAKVTGWSVGFGPKVILR